MNDNPWLRPAPGAPDAVPLASGPPGTQTVHEQFEVTAPAGAQAPQPFIPPGPGPAHAQSSRPGPPQLWWMGVHGGAGETTLAGLGSGRAAEHAWPTDGSGRHCVVLVTRSHHHGLMRARQAAAEWARGDVSVHLLGLALVADAPGRLPKPLRELAHHVTGAVPRVWRIPWVAAWRTDVPDARTAPRAVTRMLADTAALASAPS